RRRLTARWAGGRCASVVLFRRRAAFVSAIRPQWGRLSAARIDASRLCRFAVLLRFAFLHGPV
ncbi:MAG: hypothetical protein II655_06075, partial [Thermoguttaceae bacterium]|nr:hypothetical protein [Thermoguttaceae bacterium]